MPVRHSIRAVIALTCVPLSSGMAALSAGDRGSPSVAICSDSGVIPYGSGRSAKYGTLSGIGVITCGITTMTGGSGSGAGHVPGAGSVQQASVAALPAPRHVARGSDVPWTITTMGSEAITIGASDASLFAGAPAASDPIRPGDQGSIVALPEPASLALILVGVLGVTAVRARRARRPKTDPGQQSKAM